MKKTLNSIALNYGLFLGLVFVAITVIAYAVNLEILLSTVVSIGNFVLILVFGILSILAVKKAQSGFISFKNAFKSYFITGIVGVLISTIVSVILLSVIDPDAGMTLTEAAINKQIEALQAFGAPDEAIEQQLTALEKAGNFYKVSNIWYGLITYFFFIVIPGLIVAAFMKKKAPQA